MPLKASCLSIVRPRQDSLLPQREEAFAVGWRRRKHKKTPQKTTSHGDGIAAGKIGTVPAKAPPSALIPTSLGERRSASAQPPPTHPHSHSSLSAASPLAFIAGALPDPRHAHAAPHRRRLALLLCSLIQTSSFQTQHIPSL